MRSTIFFVAICLAGLSQTALATPRELLVVKLSRPNTTNAEFIEDRNACLTTANNEHWAGAGPVGQNAGAWARHHMKTFGECMGAKGYKNDPEGYRAIRYSQREGGLSIFVEAL
ncbi:MAG: hypothetical protein P4L57_06855 [Rhizomicrobium sp.]|nr:hypothetical protein [Rhizomicrobium sp.]